MVLEQLRNNTNNRCLLSEQSTKQQNSNIIDIRDYLYLKQDIEKALAFKKLKNMKLRLDSDSSI